MEIKEKKFDLDNFYNSRQQLASEIDSTYAHRQLSEIRKQVQEKQLEKQRELKKEKSNEKVVKGAK